MIDLKIIKYSLIILVAVGLYAFGNSIGQAYATEINQQYTNEVETQNTLLKGRISLLETRILVLEEEIRLSDEQISLLEELVGIQDSEINSLISFTRNTRDFKELARIIEAESGGEPYQGKLYVASVVMNRVIGSFANTVYDVIYQPRQFSPVGGSRFNRIVASQDSIAAAEQIITTGTVTDALFFMNPDFSNPASRDWMRSLTYVDTVGNHEFYR